MSECILYKNDGWSYPCRRCVTYTHEVCREVHLNREGDSAESHGSQSAARVRVSAAFVGLPRPPDVQQKHTARKAQTRRGTRCHIGDGCEC